jgi:hypothetical protein
MSTLNIDTTTGEGARAPEPREHDAETSIERLAYVWNCYVAYRDVDIDVDPNIWGIVEGLDVAICDVIGAPPPHDGFPSCEPPTDHVDDVKIEHLRRAWNAYAVNDWQAPSYHDDKATWDAFWRAFSDAWNPVEDAVIALLGAEPLPPHRYAIVGPR